MEEYGVSKKRLNTVLWVLMALEGLGALIGLLRIPSESSAALIWGYSAARLAVGGVAVLGAVVFSLFAIASISQPGWWRKTSQRTARFCDSQNRVFVVFGVLFSFFAAIAAFLLLAVSAAAQELVILRVLLARAGLLAVWAELVIIQLVLLFFNNVGRDYRDRFFSPLRLTALLAIATIIYYAAVKVYTTATWNIWMRGIEKHLFLPVILFLIWSLLHRFYRDRDWYSRVNRYMLLAAIGVVTFTLYRQTSHWVGWYFTPSKAYWHLVADAFLHGRLYLIDPASTHDMTFYQDHWYVPNPPMPALVMLPFVALVGVENINTVLFSIICGAINIVLVYVMLEKAGKLGMISTGRNGNLWLVGLLAFGTAHWWLSVMGRVWFTSQVLTLMFSLLAVLIVLYRRSPWWAGFCLGMAIMARPNVFTLWPFLLGVAVALDQQTAGGQLRWKKMLGWAVQSAIPVCAAVGALLFYNYIRFDSFFDFGYVTITSAEWLTEAVQTYGMFNFHFFQTNFHTMFLKMPFITLREGCFYYSPSREGIAIIAMTPAIVYILRRFKTDLWAISAWVGVGLTVGLLLLYHNTGAWQLGYRYLMDFIPPVMLLLAVGIGKRPSWIFKGLVLLSVLGNAAGIIWWFDLWWC